MKDIIIQVLQGLAGNLASVLSKICDAAISFFKYSDRKSQERTEKAMQKKIAAVNSEIEDACDGGSLSDLLDAVSKRHSVKSVCPIVFSVLLAFMTIGCVSVDVYAAKPWEGRYSNVTDARLALENCKLDKKEQIWILSNQTLKRLLTTEQKD